MAGSRLYLFPDTNIFLHFRCFVEIDWRGLAGCDAGLVVPIRPTINELDRIKNESRKGKLRERAWLAVRKIDALVDGLERLRDGTRFEAWAVNPAIVTGIDPNYPDDLLLASALHFAAEQGVDVAIVTDDTGLRLKAPNFGLRVLRMTEERLPPEPDEKDIEIRRLQAQVAARPSAKPKLTFKDGSTEHDVRVLRGPSESDAAINEAVEEEYYEKLEDGEVPGDDETWRRKEKARRRRVRDYEARQRVTFPVELLLSNYDGSTPADDIDITVDPPEVFSLTLTKEKAPEKPDPFRSPLAGLNVSRIAPIIADGWELDGENRAVRVLSRVKHAQSQPLEPFYLRLIDPEFRGPVELSCTINVGEPASNERSTLLIRVTGP
ncbi:MAG: PIN domain-containing protein [Pseudomonadota bacterium]